MTQNPTARFRTQRRALIAITAAVTVVTVAGATVMGFSVKALFDYQSASQRYIAAYESRMQSADSLNEAVVDRDDAIAEASSDLGITEAILLAAEDGYVGAAEKAALVAQRDSLAAVVAEGDDDAAEEVPEKAALPSDATTAELNDGAAALEAEIERLTAGTTEATGTADEVTVSLEQLESSGEAFMDALPAVAQSVLDANGSATNASRMALKSGAKQLGSDGAEWSELDGTFVAFVASAKAVQASQISEEAYARSIAGGASIDFDWAPIVIGYGEGGSMAGTSGCDVDPSDGSYYSTITLTNSVASQWGSDGNARALVTHEVGHTITCKCWDIYEASAGGDFEAWATAWAIGMGFEEEGNGTQAYGRPSDALIDASRACR
jgi:hypothetical protein